MWGIKFENNEKKKMLQTISIKEELNPDENVCMDL